LQERLFLNPNNPYIILIFYYFMDNIEQAKNNFKIAEFQTIEFHPYQASNLKEIEKIKNELAKVDGYPSKGILEGPLEEAKGHEEYIYAFKVFTDFDDVSKENTPYLDGFFQKGIYELSFLARDFKKENHRLKNAGTFDLTLFMDDSLNEILLKRMNKHKKYNGLIGKTEFSSRAIQLKLRPSFRLNVEGENFKESYNDLIKSLDNLGYVGNSFKEI